MSPARFPMSTLETADAAPSKPDMGAGEDQALYYARRGNSGSSPEGISSQEGGIGPSNASPAYARDETMLLVDTSPVTSGALTEAHSPPSQPLPASLGLPELENTIDDSDGDQSLTFKDALASPAQASSATLPTSDAECHGTDPAEIAKPAACGLEGASLRTHPNVLSEPSLGIPDVPLERAQNEPMAHNPLDAQPQLSPSAVLDSDPSKHAEIDSSQSLVRVFVAARHLPACQRSNIYVTAYAQQGVRRLPSATAASSSMHVGDGEHGEIGDHGSPPTPISLSSQTRPAANSHRMRKSESHRSRASGLRTSGRLKSNRKSGPAEQRGLPRAATVAGKSQAATETSPNRAAGLPTDEPFSRDELVEAFRRRAVSSGPDASRGRVENPTELPLPRKAQSAQLPAKRKDAAYADQAPPQTPKSSSSRAHGMSPRTLSSANRTPRRFTQESIPLTRSISAMLQPRGGQAGAGLPGSARGFAPPFQPRTMPDNYSTDWVRVGRTEIFRSQNASSKHALVEFATPICLSNSSRVPRTLHLCVYSVPKRGASSTHELVVSASIDVHDLLEAAESRVYVPVHAPAPKMLPNGKHEPETKLRPTAALALHAEEMAIPNQGPRVQVPQSAPAPLSSQSPQPVLRHRHSTPHASSLTGPMHERYALGICSDFINRPKQPMRAPSYVAKAFYTIHVAIDDSMRYCAEELSDDDAEVRDDIADHAAGDADDEGDTDKARRKGRGRRRSLLRRSQASAETTTSGQPPSASKARRGLAGQRRGRRATATPVEEADGTGSPGAAPTRPSTASSSSVSSRGNRKPTQLELAEEDVGNWALLFRSEPVERVKCKSAGGTLNLNYFSNKPLVSLPGPTVTDPTERPPPEGPAVRVARLLRLIPDKTELFSMPNAVLAGVSPTRTLKLSIFEERRPGSQVLLAHTTFTLRDLATDELGATRTFVAAKKKEREHPVGTLSLAQVEHGDDPRFFGLKVSLSDL